MVQYMSYSILEIDRDGYTTFVFDADYKFFILKCSKINTKLVM